MVGRGQAIPSIFMVTFAPRRRPAAARRPPAGRPATWAHGPHGPHGAPWASCSPWVPWASWAPSVSVSGE